MSRWSTTTNCDQSTSLPNRVAVTRPRGAGLRTVMPQRKSWSGRSSTYHSRSSPAASGTWTISHSRTSSEASHRHAPEEVLEWEIVHVPLAAGELGECLAALHGGILS